MTDAPALLSEAELKVIAERYAYSEKIPLSRVLLRDDVAALLSHIAALRQPAASGVDSLLRKAGDPLPDGCYCKPGQCMAPTIMGRQFPCRDPQKAALQSTEKPK